MVIRTSQGELEISGTAVDFALVADQIESLSEYGTHSFVADAKAEPWPFDRCLGSLEVRITEGPVKVSLSQDAAVVTAGPDTMSAFASYFRFDLHAPAGAHHHHDWFEGDEYIDKESVPLVVAIR